MCWLLMRSIARPSISATFAKVNPLQNFDPDTEGRFAMIPERNANRWFKPAKARFRVFDKLGAA